MARLPLTVYLARADLARLDRRARAAGVAKSAWAGQAINHALGSLATREDVMLAHLVRLRAVTEEIVSAHPEGSAMHSRIESRCAQFLQRDEERVAS